MKILQEERAEEQPRVVPTVPVDDDQKACALSGERFETVWDAESEDWHYLGAVRLSAETAARYLSLAATSEICEQATLWALDIALTKAFAPLINEL